LVKVVDQWYRVVDCGLEFTWRSMVTVWVLPGPQTQDNDANNTCQPTPPLCLPRFTGIMGAIGADSIHPQSLWSPSVVSCQPLVSSCRNPLMLHFLYSTKQVLN